MKICPGDGCSRVAVNAPALPGVSPEVGLSRIYPSKELFAHVAGYVGPVSDRDLAAYEDPPPLLRIPRFQIGKVGIEAKYEQELRGEAGERAVALGFRARAAALGRRRRGGLGDGLEGPARRGELDVAVLGELAGRVRVVAGLRRRPGAVGRARRALAGVHEGLGPGVSRGGASRGRVCGEGALGDGAQNCGGTVFGRLRANG